jgi:acetyltransferase-like isoleucine patch superfamily enzyme
MSVVRAEDVEAAARVRNGPEARGALRIFRGEPLDPDADWEGLLDPPLLHDLRGHLTGLRRRLRAKFNRHVPTGTLLHDRWDLARDLGFGEGTSVYDECLVMGDVQVGRHCWIGPYTVLDGLHAELRIGDHVDIGSSAQVYTHNTIERSLTGHRAPVFAKATTIGNCCFIAPQATIAPGSVIGDHSFVAAGSYVEGAFPPCSYIAGNPAKVVGNVEIQGNRARIRPRRGDRPPEPR